MHHFNAHGSSSPNWLRLVALGSAALLLASGCDACAGCGAKKKQKTEPEPEDTWSGEAEVQEDPLAGAAKAAEEKAVSLAVERSDEARILASDIKAARQEEEDDDGPARPDPIDPDPGGSIPREKLQKVFREHSGVTRKCYERQLKKNPALAGRVILQLTIDADGTVVEANVQGDTLLNERVNNCLEQEVRRWEFPQPEGGAARVRKPFSFSPKKN